MTVEASLILTCIRSEKERARQPDQWQPEEATLEQIGQAGIARDFALSLQTEFAEN